MDAVAPGPARWLAQGSPIGDRHLRSGQSDMTAEDERRCLLVAPIAHARRLLGFVQLAVRALRRSRAARPDEHSVNTRVACPLWHWDPQLVQQPRGSPTLARRLLLPTT